MTTPAAWLRSRSIRATPRVSSAWQWGKAFVSAVAPVPYQGLPEPLLDSVFQGSQSCRLPQAQGFRGRHALDQIGTQGE